MMRAPVALTASGGIHSHSPRPQHPQKEGGKKEHFDFSPLQSSHCLPWAELEASCSGSREMPNVLLAKQLIKGNQPGSLFWVYHSQNATKMVLIRTLSTWILSFSSWKKLPSSYVVFNTKLQIPSLLPHRAKLVSPFRFCISEGYLLDGS